MINLRIVKDDKKGKCGKNCYSKLRAMLVLSRVRGKYKKNRQESRKYWCNVCQAFHLTKQVKNYKE